MRWCDTTLMDSPIQVALCMSEKQYKKERKRAGVEDFSPFLLREHVNATAHFYCDKEGRYLCVVCIGDTKGRQYETVASLIVHEAVHVWQNIKDHLGEKEPSSEFEAYSIQRIVQGLLMEYRRHLEKKKKKQ